MQFFTVQLDRERSARAGAEGMFQVISITNDTGDDCTYLIDVGTHYTDIEELRKHLAKILKLSAEDIEIEEE